MNVASTATKQTLHLHVTLLLSLVKISLDVPFSIDFLPGNNKAEKQSLY